MTMHGIHERAIVDGFFTLHRSLLLHKSLSTANRIVKIDGNMQDCHFLGSYLTATWDGLMRGCDSSIIIQLTVVLVWNYKREHSLRSLLVGQAIGSLPPPSQHRSQCILITSAQFCYILSLRFALPDPMIIFSIVPNLNFRQQEPLISVTRRGVELKTFLKISFKQ